MLVFVNTSLKNKTKKQKTLLNETVYLTLVLHSGSVPTETSHSL